MMDDRDTRKLDGDFSEKPRHPSRFIEDAEWSEEGRDPDFPPGSGIIILVLLGLISWLLIMAIFFLIRG